MKKKLFVLILSLLLFTALIPVAQGQTEKIEKPMQPTDKSGFFCWGITFGPWFIRGQSISCKSIVHYRDLSTGNTFWFKGRVDLSDIYCEKIKILSIPLVGFFFVGFSDVPPNVFP